MSAPHEVPDVASLEQEMFQMPIPPDQKDESVIDEPVIDPVKPTAQSLGGDRFDFDGNLVKDNKIIKTAAEIKAGGEKSKDDFAGKKEEAKDEEVEMKVDAEGNLIDKDNKVIKKAGEFEIDDKGNVTFNETPFVQTIAEAYKAKGYSLLDEEGNPLAFEDSDEGYQTLTSAIALEEANTYIKEYIESNPEVVGLANYLRAGVGTPLDYYKSKVSTVDYTALDKVTEEADQEAVVLDQLMKMNNMKEEDAKDIVKMYKAAGSLGDKSKAALVSLQDWQRTNQTNEQQEVARLLKKEEDDHKDYIESIRNTVMTGKLGNFEIPVAERQKFVEFLVKPVDGNMSEATKQYNALPLDQQLMLDYMYFTKFDVDALVKIKLNQAKADMFSERAKRGQKIIITENFQRNGESGGIPDLANIS